MKMIKLNTTILIGASLLAALNFSCSSDDDEDRGNWVERSVFDGVPRSSAAGFTIINKGYMGTGYDGDDYLTDFWEYDFDGDFWSQKQDFPGTARSSAAAFATDTKGYVGVGYDGDNELQDFYEFDTTTGWTAIADYGGGVRRSSVSFGTNNLGYVGTGYDGDNDKKDFWRYNPATDEWTELIGFGGDKRRDAVAFNINDKVYLGTGSSNGLYKEDFWEFDTATESWTRLTDLDDDDDYDIVRSNAVAFSINGLGYITTGYNYSAISTTWEYDPSNDDWEEITALEGTSRQDATSFYNESRAFVAAGRSGSLYLDDNYELFPQQDYDDED
ncbi:Kelch repeat-containing protein [Lacinutrix undariae]